MINAKHNWNVCLQAIPQSTAYSWKTEGDWGNSSQHSFSVQQTCEATKNRPWLIIIPFRINLESFPIQKLFIFVVFSLSYNVEKSIKDCSTGNCPLARDYKTAAPLVNQATWRYPSRDSCGSTWSNQCHFLSSKTLLTYPFSACVAKCSFSSMKRIKTSLYVIRWQMSAFHPWRFYIVH